MRTLLAVAALRSSPNRTAQFLLSVDEKALGTFVLEPGGDHAPLGLFLLFIKHVQVRPAGIKLPIARARCV